MSAYTFLERLAFDCRYGFRILFKNPGFTAVAALVLGLGIGINASVFSLVNAVLLKSLPVSQPRQLVLFGDARRYGVLSGQVGSYSVFSYPLYLDFLRQNRFFSGLCAVQSQDSRVAVRHGSGGTPQMAIGKLVSGNYFSVLGVAPAAGRLLTDADDKMGAAPAAVISYRYWSDRFGRRASIAGEPLRINDTPFTIVGVAAPGFFGETLQSDPPDFWFPLQQERQLDRQRSLIDAPDSHWLFVLGRLKPGVDPRSSQASLTIELQQWLTARAGAQPSVKARKDIARARVELTPGSSGITHMRRRYADSLRLLSWIAGLVLLIACANIASLLMARGVARNLESSVRLALGASRTRLMQQSLTQSVSLALLGGLAGLLLAVWGTRILVLLFFQGSRYVPIHALPDRSVLLFTFVISIATGMFFGLAPAWSISGVDLAPVMKASGGNVKGGRRRFGAGRLLAIGQVAISLPLLIAAGLLARSLDQLEHQRFGFDPERVLMATVDPQLTGYRHEDLAALYQRLRERLRRVPGVVDVSYSLYSPFSSQWSSGVSIQGHTPAPNEDRNAWWNRVGPGYFDTLGTKLIRGRGIGEQDTADAPKIAVVNEAFRRYFFPNENPIGKRFGMWDAKTSGDIEIVGVSANAKYASPREESPRMFYIPLLQNSKTGNPGLNSALLRSGFIHDIEIRVSGDPNAAIASVRQAIAEVDRNLLVLKFETLQEQVRGSLAQESLIAQLTGIFSILAVVLACVGVYGLMSHAVERRTGEIGLRIALGAQRTQVLWAVLGDVFLTLFIGIAVGLLGAWAGTRFLTSKLYEVDASDPRTIFFAAALLLCVGALAGYLPARHASRVDPLVALRHE